MGTRNITMVRVGGKIKVMQYCQWDGYPTGQGETIAEFIQDKMDLPLFKKQVKALRNISAKSLKKIWTDAGADDSGWVSMEIADKVKAAYPEFSRDTGADILELIHSGKVKKVSQSKGQLGQSWIEFVYDLDLDKETVAVYVDGGKKPAKVIPFDKFTVKSMKKLEKELYGNEE